MQLLARYPENLIAEAIDVVDGLPSLHTFVPSLAEVKAFLEPRWQHQQHMLEMKRRFETKRLAEPERDPVEDAKIEAGLRQLSARLASGQKP